ncbi:MAG: NAD(P)H-hydrate dehydratase [Ignavibacteria bacterium]|nr:NAD(P)H-hydrate dehydratase [Ignavibacteria bacterium]MBT8382105.1 NAD(P)H-hydrate dehydratase [Ignavibacteria bacterium]MBT8392017.1 NAD(P)H-hydrate dehydratase [Ignavibacteria bacterium]NNJ51816.1 NAD(P)H-hydrate dehydratase [Ignavibacteriaceae bacterium]NNL21885.1 NAD(P)H-hydrate dehydratase [Ignavibacteriaceae bacterium]
MIPLYTTDQIRKTDEYAIDKLGIPGIVLMENASREIFRIIKEKTEHLSFNSIGFICGKGNNGGDGFAAARHFANAGYEVTLIYLSSESDFSPDCKFNYSVIKKLALLSKTIKLHRYKSSSSLSALKSCDIICDALLGSGTKGSLREPYFSIIKKLNRLKKIKVAIDIPTGLNADTGFAEVSFEADFTITLGELKRGLFFENGYLNAGEIEKGGIGIPDSFYTKHTNTDFLIEPEDALNGLPEKQKNIHKYSAGKVFTIAGSGSLPGAAVLSATSALKIGAGASILAFPNSVRSFVHKKLGEVVVQGYNDENSEFLKDINILELDKRIRWADVIAVGPGLGRDASTQKAVINLLKNFKPKRVVIDADGIFALGKGTYKKLNLNNCVITPHHAEFANLIGISTAKLKEDLLKHGKNFVKRTGAYLVLKGAPTIIFTPVGEALINTTGNPSLAKFGTGDVLTGFIAGLLAQQTDIEKAVLSAVYLHSLSADLLVSQRSQYDILARDILNHIPKTIKFLRDSLV